MNEIVKAVQVRLWDMQDLPYRKFQSKLIPTVPLETIIGVRTPTDRQFWPWMRFSLMWTIGLPAI